MNDVEGDSIMMECVLLIKPFDQMKSATSAFTHDMEHIEHLSPLIKSDC